MKRKSKKQRHPDKRKKQSDTQAEPAGAAVEAGADRREVLRRLRNWTIMGAVGLGGGWYLVDEVTAMIAEHDLSRIGNGKPTVVQVHDPQCPRCRALQRETRRALRELNRPDVQYLVANIKSSSGLEFATTHQVSHITLVLFDGNGRRQAILRGNRDSRSLYDSFRAHLGRAAGAGSGNN